MVNKYLFIFAFLILSTSVFAQQNQTFVGSMFIDRTIFNTETNQPEESHFLRLDANKDLMRLTSDGDMVVSRIFAAMKTRSIYIRSKKQDLLLMAQPREAVQISQETLNQMTVAMQQFGGGAGLGMGGGGGRAMMMEGRGGQTPDIAEIIPTDETEYVMGYLTKKIVIRRPARDEVTFVYVTDSLNVNWGVALNMPAAFNFTMTELFDPTWLKSGGFPLLAITFRGGKVRSRSEVIDIIPNAPEANDIDIARNVSLIGLTDYFMNNMMRR
jgi:hypothetical protein